MNDNNIKKYLEKIYINKANLSNGDTNTKYFVLPFIGKYSDITFKKIRALIKKYCKKDCSFKLIYRSKKIKSYFSLKDIIRNESLSNVVYKFKCASCNACYIGETSRRLSDRIKEHFKTDKTSHIYKHLHENISCFDSANISCFDILDTAANKFDLKLKEGLYIDWEKPNLNSQIFHLSCSLTL